MFFKFIPNDKGNPAGKLADVELHFEPHNPALFHGMKLIGFAVWQRRGAASNGEDLYVTFPARQYSVNGDRRSFALLRPANGTVEASNALRDAIIAAYRKFEDPTYDRPVCTNCGQWVHVNAAGLALDCSNECVRRGFAQAVQA